MKLMKNNGEAVSPVVGVMLMLVVTIIIAAVVSGFAGGMAGNTQTAPQAVFDIEIKHLANAGAMEPYGSGYYAPTMTIEEISGESIPTKDLSITMTYINSSGTLFSGTLSNEQSVNGTSDWPYFSETNYCGVLYINDQNRFTDSTIIGNDGGGSSAWFGNSSATLTPGDVLTTAAEFCGNYNDNTGPDDPHKNPSLDYLLGCEVLEQTEVGNFGTGSVVTVKIVHTPSGKIIYNKDVIVQ